MLLSVMGGLARCCEAGWTDIRATQLPVREGGHNELFRVSGVWHRQALVLSSSPWNWLFDISASLNVVKPQEQGNQMVMC